MLSRIVLFLTVITLACAATWMGRVPPIPERLADKEGCYIQEVNDVIPFGQEITPLGNCIRISCSSNMIHYASCGVVMVNGVKLTKTDLTKPYPECCPTLDNEIDNNII